MTKTKTPAEIVRAARDFDGKKMQKFDINGKTVVTNFGAYETTYYVSYAYRPNVYTKEVTLGIRSNKTVADVFNELVNQGYNKIMILQGRTGMIIADTTYIWAGKANIK